MISKNSCLVDSYDLAQFCAYVRILYFSIFENTYCIHILYSYVDLQVIFLEEPVITVFTLKRNALVDGLLMTQFQYNPSNECGGGMKMKVVK